MSVEFTSAQQELTSAREARDAAFEEHARAREQLRRLQAFDVRESSAELGSRLDAARGEVERTANDLLGAREVAAGALAGFAAFSDPRESLAQLSDDTPILLFPLRLETRFKTVGAQHQLWVRVFVDECLIDTFEPELAAPELRSARAYWLEHWRAGGNEDGRRAAWRNLVRGHGSGRAEWIVERFKPSNPGDEPAGADVVLVIDGEAPPEDGALATYWEAAWRAGGDADAHHDAYVALEDATDVARAAELSRRYRPFNLHDKPVAPKTAATAIVRVAFIALPADPLATVSSWTRAPKVDLLPERLVLRLEQDDAELLEVVGGPVRSPLYVGPDPSAPPEQSIHVEDGELVVPGELDWLVDFDAAVGAGMGFRVDITAEQAARGFDRVLVVGVRLSADAALAQTELERLIDHHRTGRSGFALVPQGTPTNNTEQQGAGYRSVEDADESFDQLLKGPLFTPTSDERRKSDGQRLAEGLGIGAQALARVRHSDGLDGRDALAMNTALWPGTLGYFLETMMHPLLGDAHVDATRDFFIRYVTGRGALPAVRIGGQPYGVLATTAFTRIRRPRSRLKGDGDDFLGRLYALLRHFQAHLTTVAQSVAHVDASTSTTRSGDPQRDLLDILGLHPASVEFHTRYAQSVDHLFNHLNLSGDGAQLTESLDGADPGADALARLRSIGYVGEERPALFDLVFHAGQSVLDGGVVDDVPLSEEQAIRAYAADGRNYLEWLTDAAKHSLESLRREAGFTDERTPRALLYLLARHALLLGYHDAGYRLHGSAEALPADTLRAMKQEPPFVHVAAAAEASESRFTPLYDVDARITGSETLSLADFITRTLAERVETGRLQEQIEALELLAGASTARLERAFVEHLDLCGYRLDAWLLGFVRLQLEAMRSRRPEGTYIGAYGYLEDLRPKSAAPQPVQLPADLQADFNRPGESPLVHDPGSGGFIHAPSLDHATTAAVLRSGYLANGTPDGLGPLSVDLSSRRVRTALNLLEGIRSGQPLGALLGYRFERGLHDRHDGLEVDRFIYALRGEFAFASGKLTSTAPPAGTSIDVAEARNVVDGLRLVEHARATGSAHYPFGRTGLPPADAAERAAIDAEVEALVDVHDALADLALAEGVHQASRGNFDRAAGTLAAYTQGHFPPEPDVVRTPRTGIGLTHRVGLHFDPTAAAPAGATPRAKAEPAVDAWLASVLPPLTNLLCEVHWTDPLTGGARSTDVTLAELGLRPIDLLYLAHTDDEQQMTELDDRIVRRALAKATPRPDAELAIRYLVRRQASVSLFELAPLIRALRAVLLRSRPLRATDVTLHNEASPADDADVIGDRAATAATTTDIEALNADLTAFLAVLDPLLADLPNRRAEVVATIDASIDDGVALLARAASFGMKQGGFGFALAWRGTTFRTVLERIRERVARLDAKLAEFDAALTAYDLPQTTPDHERFLLLQGAEAKISTVSSPLPPTPAALRATVGARRPAFVAKRDALAALLDTSVIRVSDLLDAVEAELPIAAFDPMELTLEDIRDLAVVFATDLAAAVRAAATEAAARAAGASALLDEHDAAAAGPVRFDALDAAAKTLLGDDFRVLPRFALATARGAEWQHAYDASRTGALLDHLQTGLSIRMPVDEWLAGVSTVREKVRAWHQVALYSGLFGRPEPELTPIQLPFKATDSWLALQFPADYALDGDRLLYTAHYPAGFAPAARQCGVLLDEWTEVLPAATQTTGLTFHYDRPNSEPPQSLLLVTPASLPSGGWQWGDLVGAVTETFELARLRAVEPTKLDETDFAPLLPAVVTAATLRQISISLVLADNDGVREMLHSDG